VDPEAALMAGTTAMAPGGAASAAGTPVVTARGLVKRFGPVTALAGADLDLMTGEILALIGDNGAGKSSLIKALSGALVPDEGEIHVAGQPVHFTNPLQARDAGIETVYQTLAVAPSLDIASNLFLGREKRRRGVLGSVFRMLDHTAMRGEASDHLNDLGIMTIQNPAQAVETLSGGQRQAVAVARGAAFGSRVIIMDEPTAALGVRESRAVIDLILEVRSRGLAVIIVSHDMPLVFEIADRIHVQRLGRRIGVVTPESHSMTDVVAIMTGAAPPPQ
jgi:fructose transport system ATP-binding protein